MISRRFSGFTSRILKSNSVFIHKTQNFSNIYRRSILNTFPQNEVDKIKKYDTLPEDIIARTDPSVEVEFPEHGLTSSAPVQGRGGLHFKRTLASFSLENKVGVVTGGAGGLGLVMSQALIISGADVAIVDLNSKSNQETHEFH